LTTDYPNSPITMPAIKYRRGRRLLSSSQRKEMIRLVLEDGQSVNSVAKQFKVGWAVVDYWIKKARRLQSTNSPASSDLIAKAVSNSRSGRRYVSPADKARAISLVLDEGLSSYASANRTGYSHTAVVRWVKEAQRDKRDTAGSVAEQPTEPSVQDRLMTEQTPASQEPIADLPSVPEGPFDIASGAGTVIEVPAGDCDQLREQVDELRVERDFLRLIVAHFIAPTMDAAGMKVTFTHE
jgi:transposase-like protein